MAEKKEKAKAKDKKEPKGKNPEQKKVQPEKLAPEPAAIGKSETVQEDKSQPKPLKGEPKSKPAPTLQERTAMAQKKAEERAAALAVKRQEALERAQAEAAARKLAWEKHKEEMKAKAEARAAQMRETAEARKAEREAARKAAAELQAEKARQAKAEREAKLAERQKLRDNASTMRTTSSRSNSNQPTAKAAPKTGSSKPSPNNGPIPIGIDLGIPAAVSKAWAQAVKIAAKSTQEQTLSYLKPAGGGDARSISKLDLQRKKIAKDLEDSLVAVVSRILSADLRLPALELKLNDKTAKLHFTFPEFGLSQDLKRGLQAPMRDLHAQLGGQDGAIVHFPALATPLMLQFFGDLETGQQFDGSVTFSFQPENPSNSKFDYHLTFAGKGKKSKEPSVVLTFSHDLGLNAGKGTISGSAWVQLPEQDDSKK